jgi:hypothetical protein
MVGLGHGRHCYARKRRAAVGLSSPSKAKAGKSAIGAVLPMAQGMLGPNAVLLGSLAGSTTVGAGPFGPASSWCYGTCLRLSPVLACE